jgi:hypothetical protein
MSALTDFRLPRYRYYPRSGGVINSGPQTWMRISILQALERLNISYEKWPPFAKVFADEGFMLPGDGSSYLNAQAFQPPAFDLLRDTVSGWQVRADALWEQHRKSFVLWCKKHQAEDLKSGRYIRVKQYRSTGLKRIIASTDTRFEWAALRMSGLAYPEIARQYSSGGRKHSPKQIEMSCREIFADAGLKPTDTE